MSTEANKALLVRINEAIAAGRLGELEGHPDLWETRHVIPMMHMMFADWQLGPTVQLAEGSMVCSYGTMTVQHSGRFAGIAGTGRRIALEVISIDRVDDGKVVAHNSASTWYNALPVLGARGFDAWPVRSEPAPMRQPVPSGDPQPTPALMHELLTALCAGDRHAVDGHPGMRDVVEHVSALREAFSHLAYTPVTGVIEGDMAGTRGTLSGTHTGELHGLAPTGQPASWDWFSLARIAGGTVVEQRSIGDWNSALRQLGILASPTEAPNIAHTTLQQGTLG